MVGTHNKLHFYGLVVRQKIELGVISIEKQQKDTTPFQALETVCWSIV